LGIHAARITLARTAGEESPTPDLASSLFLALAHGHPGLASGSIDRGALLAFHRQAWSIAGLRDDDPWKELLNIPDPVERVIHAARADFPLSESDLSSLVLEAVASQRCDELRSALSLVLYLRLRSSKKIAATAAETLSTQLTRVLNPSNTTHQVYGKALARCREVANACSDLTDSTRDTYLRNLLNAFLPDGFKEIEPANLKLWFQNLWKRFGLPNERSA